MARPGRHENEESPLPRGPEAAAEPPALSVSRETVCYIILKAREFDAKDVATLSDDGSDPPDEGMRSVLEDRPDDPVRQELFGQIRALTFDEQVDLVTLTWIGRGDGTLADWAELRDLAASRHNQRTASYLLGIPLLGDYLSEGLATLGYSCEDITDEHFQI